MYRNPLFEYFVTILLVLVAEISCNEFGICYNESHTCFWTNGTVGKFQEAQQLCSSKYHSFIPRVNDSDIESKMQQFRIKDQMTFSLLDLLDFWIDVSAVRVNRFHWIDGQAFANDGEVLDQIIPHARFAVLVYNANHSRFTFHARQWNDSDIQAYICQTPIKDANCSVEDLIRKSTNFCYTKVETDSPVTWYSASNGCLSRGGSLAVFSDLERPSDDQDLMAWLGSSHRPHWIGLVRRWWTTTNFAGNSVDIQYSNWGAGEPSSPISDLEVSVIMTRASDWRTANVYTIQKIVCQNYTNVVYTTPAPPENTTQPSHTESAHHIYCEELELGLGIGLGLGIALGIPSIAVCIICYKVRQYKKEKKLREEAKKAQEEAKAHQKKFGNRRHRQSVT